MKQELIDKLFCFSSDSIANSSIGTANETGTGLGLMLCKDFVDKHNGKIWVETKPNQGSRFYFTLPVAR